MLSLFNLNIFSLCLKKGREEVKKNMQSYIEHIKIIPFAPLMYFPHSPG